jgi:poly-gamma-glutamate synthesis protein (capsule biosynthesis protein)
VHVLRGIEIYKGRPIFYGLGEFFRQMDGVLGPYTGEEPSSSRPLRNSPPIKYQGVVAVSRFAKGSLREIRLWPIDLGHERRFADRGVPRSPSLEVAVEILERLEELSAPFGTVISIENGVGIVRP